MNMRPLQRKIEWCAKGQWVLAASLGLFLAAFYLLGYRTANQRLSDLRMQIQTKERDLQSNQSRAKILPVVEKEVARLQSRLELFDHKLPKQQELPQFIREITQVSQHASLRKVEVKPGVGHKSELYSEMPITLTFQGDFLNVFSFLRQTEQMQRLTRVQNLTVKSLGGKPGEVEVQVSMNIYFSEG
jgi:Tfp pilus assembly protein PilO